MGKSWLVMAALGVGCSIDFSQVNPLDGGGGDEAGIEDMGGDCPGARERCNGLDDDCDGRVDEDYRVDFAEDDPTSIFILGEQRFLDEVCGLLPPCGQAVVVCSDDELGLTCDSAAFAQPERCNDLDDDCDTLVDEDFLSGPGADPAKLWNDPVVDETNLGLGEACGVGACTGGLVVCNSAEDKGTCSTRSNRADNDLCGDGLDNNCNGEIDEGNDRDQDGFQECARCLRPGERCVRGHDCDDDPSDDTDGLPRAREIFPGAADLCDGIDNNCSGGPDEDFSHEIDGRRLYTDRNHCGRCGTDCEAIGASMNTIVRCEVIENDSVIDQYSCSPRCQAGYVDADGDILASEPSWYQNTNGCDCERDEATFCDDPNGVNCAERCDGRDNDCDGQRDEADNMQLAPCYTGPPSTRNVGICRDGRIVCRDGEPRPEICQGEQTPIAAVERTCDGLDEDCDGRIDEGTDLDGDGFAPCRSCVEGEAPVAGVAFCVSDCNDNPEQDGRRINPSASETCNGVDDDCDRFVDDDFVIVNNRGEPLDAQGNVVVGTAIGLIYNTNAHCGACGITCAPANGLGTCETGVCRLVECRPGFLNLDGREDNGCETSD